MRIMLLGKKPQGRRKYFIAKSKLTAPLLLVLIVVSVIYLFLHYSVREIHDFRAANLSARLAQSAKPAFVVSSADAYEPATTAFVVLNENGNVLRQMNADEILPIASLTKLLTAKLALFYLPEGEITMDIKAIGQAGDVGFTDASAWKRDDLIKIMLMSSSNDAAERIGREIEKSAGGTFAEVASLFEAKHDYRIRAENATGLDAPGAIPTAHGSAFGVAKIMTELLEERKDIMETTRLPELEFISPNAEALTAINTNVAYAGRAELIAGKTGYTDGAGGSLIVVYKHPRHGTVIAALLGSGFYSRFSDMDWLLKQI